MSVGRQRRVTSPSGRCGHRTLAGETTRLDCFLGDLLALAQLEADDFRLDIAPTDLTALAEQAGAFWSGPCAQHGVELRVEVAEAARHGLVADTDAFRARQLITAWCRTRCARRRLGG